jgi:hypothetical protein
MMMIMVVVIIITEGEKERKSWHCDVLHETFFVHTPRNEKKVNQVFRNQYDAL